jgi:ribonuclease D
MARRRPFQPQAVPEHVVATPDQYAAFLDHVRGVNRLGLDTEFVGEDSYRPELCLVQVSTPDALFVVDPLACGSLHEFWELLLDPARVVVVHAGREELRMARHAVGAAPANVFDVQIGAALVGLAYPIGYAGLVQEVLAARAHKGETLTDWRRRPLTPAQVKYAFDDVRFLLPLWERLADRLKRLKRTEWAAEEFEAFARWAVSDEPAVEKWRRLKGLGGLSRRELAVARELFVWREDFAARLNRPPRVLLRDDLIVEIARRGPSRPDDVQYVRGIPRGEGDSIRAAVARALALPTDDLPAVAERDNDLPHVATLASLLGVVLSDFCLRNRLAPNFVATSADLKALVRARQRDGRPPTDSSLASGWRADAVRPHLEAVLDGDAVIRIADPTAANPIAVEPIAPPEPPGPLEDTL